MTGSIDGAYRFAEVHNGGMMACRLVVAFFTLLSAGVTASVDQDPQPPFPAGKTEGVHSEEWTATVRNPDTGRNETVQQWLHTEMSYQLVPTSSVEVIALITCTAGCDAEPNHGDHSACEPSCDSGCTRIHRIVAAGHMDTDTDEKQQQFADSMRSLDLTADFYADTVGKGKLPIADLREQNQNLVNQIAEHAEVQRTIVFPHLGAGQRDPCWEAEGVANRRKWTLRCELKVIKNTRAEGGARVTREEVGARTVDVASFWFVSDTLASAGWALGCACAPFELPAKPSSTGEIFIHEGTRVRRLFRLPEFGYKSSATNKEFIESQQTQQKAKCFLKAKGVDLNTVGLEAKNDTGKEVTLQIVPGMVFVPRNPRTQVMIVGVGQVVLLKPGETRVITVRVLCAEKEKDEPDENDEFLLANPNDNAIATVCGFMNKSRFRGPWDQARVWIFSDQAPLSEINKRLIPGCSKGRYLNNLFDLARSGSIDMEAPATRKLMDPTLLTESGSRLDAVEWFIAAVASQGQQAIIDLVLKNKEFQELCSKPKDASDAMHGATVAKSLCRGKSKPMQLAGLECLLKTFSKDKKKEAEQAGAMAAAGELIHSKDPQIAEEATEVVDVYSHKVPKEALQLASKHGVSEKVKEWARKALAAN